MRPPARHWRSSRRIALGCALLLAALPVALPAAALRVLVRTADGHPLQGAVVTVTPVTAVARPQPPVHAVMDQVNRSFTPDLLVLPVGSTITFPNSDTVSHQIYSFSPARRFQLPLYRGTPYPPVQFDKPGIVTLGCNIHDSMLAYVFVTDAPWSGRTDDAGSWSVELPRGRYRLAIWHPRLREDAHGFEREFSVEDAPADLSVSLRHALQPEPPGGARRSWDSY